MNLLTKTVLKTNLTKRERVLSMVILLLCYVALASLSLALGGCNQPHDGLPALPPDRPATLAEAQEGPLAATLSYDPASVPQPFWAAWRGLLEVGLAGPQAGLAELPGSLEAVSGLEELDDGCLGGASAAFWRLDPATGDFLVETLPEDASEAVLSLAGTLVVHSRWAGSGEGYTTPHVVSELRGSGRWRVTPGTGCGPDDFQGGLEGPWEARPASEQAAASAAIRAPRAPRVRLLVVGPEGVELEVRGPLPEAVRVLKAACPRCR